MKTKTTIGIGIFLSLAAIFIISSNIENGDINAISMYFIVYGIYAIALGVVNGIYLKICQSKNNSINILFAILPVIILIGTLFSEDLYINFFSKIGVIGIGITNLIWIVKIKASS